MAEGKPAAAARKARNPNKLRPQPQPRSLLPAGVSRVTGIFGRGEPVELAGPNNEVLAQGLTRYTSDEATRIAGHRSDEIEALLGYPGRAALVHRDDLAMLSHEE